MVPSESICLRAESLVRNHDMPRFPITIRSPVACDESHESPHLDNSAPPTPIVAASHECYGSNESVYIMRLRSEPSRQPQCS